MHQHIEINAIIQRDIAYKVIDGKALNLDIYLPKSAQTAPFATVIFLHGGAWTRGTKSSIISYDRPYIVNELLSLGYAVVSIDYRLVDTEKVHFPAPVADCKDAIRWIRKHASAYHLNRQEIGIWGASAGAHIAMLAAYSREDDFPGDCELQEISSKANYLINNFGPADLNHLLRPEISHFFEYLIRMFARNKFASRKEALLAITGRDIRTEKASIVQLCRRYSPINYVGPGSIPTLILHGTKDDTVPLKQSQELARRLKANGVSHQLVCYPGLDHGFKNADKNAIRENVKTTVSFIKKYTH